MRRFSGHLVTLGSIALAVLWLGLVTVWVRSYSARDRVSFTTRDRVFWEARTAGPDAVVLVRADPWPTDVPLSLEHWHRPPIPVRLDSGDSLTEWRAWGLSGEDNPDLQV